MREGWMYKKLGEVGSFLRGSGILKSDFVEDGCPCIHYGQIHTKFGVSVDSHLSEISETLFAKSKIANPGDIILAITSEDVEGSCKCIAWLGNYDVAVGAHAAIFKHNQNPKYLSYCFRSKDFGLQKAKYAHGFKVVEIKPSEVAEISIPIPPLTTQQQIVSELDLLSHILAQKRQQLKEYDALAESIFYDMFGDPVENPKGWEKKTLGEISMFRRGSFPQPYGEQKWYGGDDSMPFVQVADMQDEDFELSFPTKKQISIIAQPMSVFVQTGTVLVSLQGSIGKVSISQFDCYVDRTVAIFYQIAESLCTKIFFAYIIKYIFAEKRKKARGISIKTITKEEFTAFDCLLPPLSLQRSFAAKIESIEHQKQLLRASIKETEMLFQSRMDYWFNE